MTEPNKERGSFQVRFAANRVKPDSDQVVIFTRKKTAQGWNDFGFFIRCEFEAFSQQRQKTVVGELFLGFIPSAAEEAGREVKKYGDGSLPSRLQGLNKLECGPEALPQYFTMLPDMAGYRALVATLGRQEADALLRSINDLVVSRDSKNPWFERAISTEVFGRAFMRNSEPFFAYHNAQSVLRGLENEDKSAVSKSIDLNFSLEGFSNPHHVEFRFGNDGLIPRRINVLIGKNGTGKSQVLKAFCRAALGYKDKGVTFRDAELESDRPMINRVLAVSTPGETIGTFPAERAKTQKLYYRRLQLTRNGRARHSNSIGASLVQLVRKADSIAGKTRWRIFVEALSKVLPVEDVIIQTKRGANVRLVDFEQNDGEETLLDRWSNVDLRVDPKICFKSVLNPFGEGEDSYPLSSGQLTFFKFALLCSLNIENGSFVLMDEPETHMHPNMISDFVELLDGLLEATGSQAILATHSAYLVREVPAQQVHVFQVGPERAISILQPRLSTFGATLDSISQFVFNEDVVVKLTDKIFEKAKEVGFEQVDAQLSEEISLAALMDIKRRFEREG